MHAMDWGLLVPSRADTEAQLRTAVCGEGCARGWRDAMFSEDDDQDDGDEASQNSSYAERALVAPRTPWGAASKARRQLFTCDSVASTFVGADSPDRRCARGWARQAGG
jgi:hypothetical protein